MTSSHPSQGKRARFSKNLQWKTNQTRLPHFEGLTDDLIGAVDDPVKLKGLVATFYRKVNSVETEYEQFKTDQRNKFETAKAENDRLKAVQLKTESEIDRLKAEHVQKLQEAESQKEVFKEELYKKIYEALEVDLSCTICSEIFIQPTVLECGHTYCHHCIKKWKDEVNADCPICRMYSFNPLTKQIGMDNFITKIHTMLSQDVRYQRDQLIKIRMDSSNSSASATSGSGLLARRTLSFLVRPGPVLPVTVTNPPPAIPSTSAVASSSIPGRLVDTAIGNRGIGGVLAADADANSLRICNRLATLRAELMVLARGEERSANNEVVEARADVANSASTAAVGTDGSSRSVVSRNVARRGGGRPLGVSARILGTVQRIPTGTLIYRRRGGASPSTSRRGGPNFFLGTSRRGR